MNTTAIPPPTTNTDAIQLLNDLDDPRDHRIYTWISDQARIASSLEPRTTMSLPKMDPRYLSVAFSTVERADSPVLGFELDVNTREERRDKPLPVTPPLTPTQTPPSASASASTSVLVSSPLGHSHSVPLPPSFTRLPIHPKSPIPAPKPANHSPSSSIHSRTSASSLPYAHSLTIHTRTSSQSSLCSSPSVSRRPSLARQPSLPLLGETSVLPPLPPKVAQSQSPPRPFMARSRSTSLASLSSLYHLPTGYEPTSPQRRQSRFPAASSQPSLSGVLTPPSTGSVRDAVYIDSEEVRERLDELLAAAAIVPESGEESTSTESYPGYVFDSYAAASLEGTCEDEGQEIELPKQYQQQQQDVMEIRSPDGLVLAFPVAPTHVPPLSPPLTPGYYQTPYASSSQIYLGPPLTTAPSTPPRPAPAPPLALDDDVVDEELFFRPSAPTPVSTTTVAPTSTTPFIARKLNHQNEEKSRWSMSSSVDVAVPPLSPGFARKEAGRRRSVSVGIVQREKKEKEGKRKRLVSFISRLGNGGAKDGVVVEEREVVEEMEEMVEEEEEEEVPMPLTPAASSETHVVPANSAVEEKEQVDEEATEEWEEDLLLVKDAHAFPYAVDAPTPTEPALAPGELHSIDSRISRRYQDEQQQERYRASLEEDEEDEDIVLDLDLDLKEPKKIEEPIVRRSVDDWQRGSIVGSPRSTPASPLKNKAQSVGGGRLRSMSSLSSLNLVAKMSAQSPPVPSPAPSPLPVSSSITTSKPTSSLKNLIQRMGLVSVPPPPPPPSPMPMAAPAAPRRSLVLSQSEGKRKLVISGVEDDVAVEAVRTWCEAFGELRKFSRKREGKDGQCIVVVDFKERRVADMVCRLQAQVYIKGAGSVNLSWIAKK